MRLLLIIVVALISLAVSDRGYAVEPNLYVEATGNGESAAQQRAQNSELEFIKRFLPAKERRAPLEGFDDMSGFLRTIDGIQKPRFG